ncbi:anthrone oxygenase family protein [Mycobacterium sp. NPDC003449]
MNSSPVIILTALTALVSAAVGGIFYAFSTFVMRGLDRTDPVDAITAMRGMNAEANANPAFLVLFTGSALLALAVGIVALTRLGRPGGWLLLAGAIFGMLGFVVTMAFNVPLNEHLDRVDLADAGTEWRSYFSSWTAWNHVRTGGGLLGAALLTAGLLTAD